MQKVVSWSTKMHGAQTGGRRSRLPALTMALLMLLCICPTPRVALAAQTTIQPGPTDGIDTRLDDDNPNSNYGTSNYLYFCMLADVQTWKVEVSLIKFDLSSLVGKTITSATFYFYESDLGAGWHDRGTAYAHRILSANSAWTESGATWNHKVGSTHWAGDVGGDHGTDAGCTQSGVDWDATPLGSVNCGNLDLPEGTEFSMSWDVTEFMEMIGANYGYVCYSTSGLGPIPYSSDYTSNSLLSFRSQYSRSRYFKLVVHAILSLPWLSCHFP